MKIINFHQQTVNKPCIYCKCTYFIKAIKKYTKFQDIKMQTYHATVRRMIGKR